MTMRPFVFASIILPAAGICSDVEKMNPTEVYKGVAVSHCISSAFKDNSKLSFDAMNSTISFNSMLRLPNQFESDDEIAALVERYLQKPERLPEKGKEPLFIMTCIGLYHSPELDALAKKYVKD